ncbi:MAG: hypothetical protein EP307_10150 [Rhodobacteraceae bacterium]|nr:MAG: hypothetical protein EP307_10150 [Paracoccaceae bacterium]
MMRRLLVLLLAPWLVWAAPAAAQDDSDDDSDGGGFLERLLEDSLSGVGRDVRITGFRGALSSQATLDTLTIADETGVWLRLEKAQLDWTRSALLRRRLEVDTLSAERIEILRRPVPVVDDSLPPAETTEFALPDLPVSVSIGEVRIDRLVVAADVIGQAAELAVDGQAQLAGGAGNLRFDLRRLDQEGGQFLIVLGFEPQSRVLELDIALSEPPGGIAAGLLNIPGAPETALSVVGTGPLDDFTARIRLATEKVERLGGTVTLQGAEAGATRFAADLGGDVTPLFAPEYRGFFGPNVQLAAAGLRAGDGALTLERMDLRSQALSLSGRVALNAQGWPLLLDIEGRIAQADGADVVLPLAGPQTRLRGATLDLDYDAAAGDRLAGRIGIDGFAREGVAAERIDLGLDGVISLPQGAPARIAADVTLAAAGLDLGRPGMNDALGGRTDLRARVAFAEGDRLRLDDLTLQGPDYRLAGDVAVSGLSDALDIAFDLSAEAADLARFSGLAGRDLGGRIEARARGRVSPLEGSFDIEASGQGGDLRLGQDQADRLLAGQSAFVLDAARGADGITLRRLSVETPNASAGAEGNLARAASRLSYRARLADVGLLAPQFQGATEAQGTLSHPGDGNWRTESRIAGPYGLDLTLAGQATGPGAELRLDAKIPDIRPIVPDLAGPMTIRATASPDGAEAWRIDAQAQGAGGLTASVKGGVRLSGDVDLKVEGQAPLALSEPFLRPRSLSGTARYDLSVRGRPSLAALSGRIETQDARLVAPNLGIVLQDIAATIDLTRSRASIALRADNSTGGRLSAEGLLGLSGGLPADLRLTLAGGTFVDPSLYRVQADANITVTGPLASGARIAGAVTLGESTLLVEPSGATAAGPIPRINHLSPPAAVLRTLAYAGLTGEATAAADAGATGPVHVLDIAISAPRRLFVRGRGINAELSGDLRLAGTTAQMRSEGALDLVRGRVEVLGKRFDLNEGRVDLQGSLDPFLRFVATSTTRDGTASIIIEGPASAPEVSFVASPERPEDEVLALLFFGRDLSKLSTFQTLQLASAVATLAGNSGADVIGRLRRGFNLDDFDVVTDEDGGTAVRAGKYISENIYTDVTVGGSNADEVSLNLDVTPQVTLRGSVNSDGDTSLGVFFERDY